MTTPKENIYVKIKNTVTGIEQVISTNVSGISSFNVAAGTYEVTPLLPPNYMFKSDSPENYIVDANNTNNDVSELPYIVEVSESGVSTAIIVINATGSNLVTIVLAYTPDGHSWIATLTNSVDYIITVSIICFISNIEPPPSGIPSIFDLIIPANTLLSNTVTIDGYNKDVTGYIMNTKLFALSDPADTIVMLEMDILNTDTYISKNYS